MMMALTSGAMSSAFALILLLCYLAVSPAAVAGTESLNAAGNKRMMDRFVRWQGAYNRSYTTGEEKQRRFEVYRQNMEYIEVTNRVGSLTYQLSENQFTDLTPEEFVDRYTTKDMTAPVHDDGVKKASNASFSEGIAVNALTGVDWRSQGAMTPIKSQGHCESCWAFVTAATIESLNKIKTGKLVSLSEQELIDCNSYDGGCHRGHFTNGYRWVIQNGGMTTSADYRYQGCRTSCNHGKVANRIASISNYVRTSGEAALLCAVTHQPVAAGSRWAATCSTTPAESSPGSVAASRTMASPSSGMARMCRQGSSTGSSRTPGEQGGARRDSYGCDATLVAGACVASPPTSRTLSCDK